MAPEYHAVVLLGTLIGTILLAWRYGNRKNLTSGFCGRWTILGILFSVLAILAPHSHEGVPVMQYLICLFCIMLITLTINKPWVLIALPVPLTVLCISLTNQYLASVQLPEYTGYPGRRSRSAQEAILINYKYAIKQYAGEEGARYDNIYPPGWVADVLSEVNVDAPKIFPEPICEKKWHTHISGIWHVRGCRHLGAWYPGGRLSEAIDGIEIRVKSETPNLEGVQP